jgi:hypothetical protein
VHPAERGPVDRPIEKVKRPKVFRGRC